MRSASIARTTGVATAMSHLAHSFAVNAQRSTLRLIPSSSRTSNHCFRTHGITSRSHVSNSVAISASLSFCASTAKNAMFYQKNMTPHRLNTTDADSVRRPWRQALQSSRPSKAPKKWQPRPLTRPVLSLWKPIRNTRSPKKPPTQPPPPRQVSCHSGAEQRLWLRKIRIVARPVQRPRRWMRRRRLRMLPAVRLRSLSRSP